MLRLPVRLTLRVVAVVGAGDGFSANARQRIEAAAAKAEEQSAVAFSVCVGRAEGDARSNAQRLLARVPNPERAHVLVFVSPAQRHVEVVTNEPARRRISDEASALAVLSMTTSFSVGDLAGGIVNGIRMLSESARYPD